MGCKGIVVENKYTDRDFLIDHANYYVRCFEKYDRLCKRIHLFKVTFKDDDHFISLLTDKNNNKIEDNYLGFIVAKPLPEAIFGRTVVDTYPTDNTGRHYPALRKYEINLFGLKMVKNSLAFQEQDTVTAACATCALWSALQKTTKIFDRTWTPTPIEITQFATKYHIFTRPIPSTGLQYAQMLEAIRGVGLDFHFVDIGGVIGPTFRNIPLQSLIYSYLHRMELPVIFGGDFKTQDGRGGGHAVTITGYNLRKTPFVDREVPDEQDIDYCNLKGRRIDKFYAHDDQVGPFCKMEIKTPNRYPIILQTDPDVDYQVWEIITPGALIIPLYEKIRIQFQDVYRWILKLNIFLETIESISHGQLEWDIYLTEANTFKNEVLGSNLYKPFKLKILYQRMPRYIWRCIGESNGNKNIEIIADATDMPRSFFLTDINMFDDDLRKDIKNKMKIKEICKKCNDKLSEHFTKLIIKNL